LVHQFGERTRILTPQATFDCPWKAVRKLDSDLVQRGVAETVLRHYLPLAPTRERHRFRLYQRNSLRFVAARGLHPQA
jgi:hypothetical protein